MATARARAQGQGAGRCRIAADHADVKGEIKRYRRLMHANDSLSVKGTPAGH